MGSFDPLTQRRTENLEEAVILPVSEVLPSLQVELPGLPVKNWTLENLRKRTEP